MSMVPFLMILVWRACSLSLLKSLYALSRKCSMWITLNSCLGTLFSDGELYFRSVRCDEHVNTEIRNDEIYDHRHIPGFAVLHRGRHRHGARATTSGIRINLLLWCRSSTFRELRKYQKDFSSWCTECQREKKERQNQPVAAMKLELLRRAS